MNSIHNVDVLVTGLNIIDILVRIPEKVQRGVKHEIHELLIQGGAPAGNAASRLSSLGWRTGFIARMGNDTLSSIARVELARHGVLDNYLITDASASPGVALVEIDSATGERTVFYTLNGYQSLKASDIPSDDVKHAKLILVDGYETEAAIVMLEAAQGTDCRSVLDVEAGEPTTVRKMLELGTDIILPLAAAQQLSGESDAPGALRNLSSWTRGQLIVTDGARGSWALTPEGILHQCAFQVAVVDTTGCGDAYHAAYASALLDGFPLSLRMEFASWIAAEAALNLGGRSNLPTRDSLKRADKSMLSAGLRSAIGSEILP
jgi:sugar/nucleoside kinase (ribokinase family)